MVRTLDSDHGVDPASAPSHRVSVCAPARTASESADTPAVINSCATESSTVSRCAAAGGSGNQYTLPSPTLPTVSCAVPEAEGTTVTAAYVQDGAADGSSTPVHAAAAALAAAASPARTAARPSPEVVSTPSIASTPAPEAATAALCASPEVETPSHTATASASGTSSWPATMPAAAASSLRACSRPRSVINATPPSPASSRSGPARR